MRVNDAAWSTVLDLGPKHARTALAASGSTVACWAWEPRPIVCLLDTGTGAELHRETCSPLGLWGTDDGFVGLDEGWRKGSRRVPELVRFRRTGDRVEIERHGVPAGTHVIGAAPDGVRLVLWRDGQADLCRWRERDLEPVATWSPRYATGVDWEAGCVWGVAGAGEGTFVIDALDGSWTRATTISRWSRIEGVGCGVLRIGSHGILVFRPGGRLLAVVPPTSRYLADVDVADQGRSVRAILGTKPRRFDVDLEAGSVVDAPADAPHLAGARPRAGRDVAWHPTFDLVAIDRRWPGAGIYTTAGRFIHRLPDRTRPQAWLPSAEGLLSLRALAETTTLERWDVVHAAD